MVGRAQETTVVSGNQEKASDHSCGPGYWRMSSSTQATQVDSCGKPVSVKRQEKRAEGAEAEEVGDGDHGSRTQGGVGGANRAAQWKQFGLGGSIEGTGSRGGKGSRSEGLEFEHDPC